ncbi:uncharacterized protein PV09_06001 [Verruconis gallopava]|uniref:Apple domain-containing protein n=1 Tax=Verruconis gallopava TaxID=253628 RepID=A0A0D2A7N2_9PEZI|nr:uncharacterized protein PV09_06001 [Verruconis gallopava]KIW02545.1 hypothetical protein PV09_06001 [Verruconis gallopava]
MPVKLSQNINSLRARRFFILAIVTLSIVSFLYSAADTAYVSEVRAHLSSWPNPYSSTSSTSLVEDKTHSIRLDPRCANLTGADDVLLVMKTGSSVIEKRLPVHFNTTFRCTPHFLVFSDMAQNFNGLEIHDALDELYKYVDMSNPDLAYYKYLKETSERKKKKEGKQHQNKAGDWSRYEEYHYEPEKDDEIERPEFRESDLAWEMDKYKNYPILRKSYAMYPDKKWYMFVDADTSIMWSNVLTWLQMLDPTKPIYTGSQNWIGDVEFAHGGSGYIVSQAAAKILADEDEEQTKAHTSYAEGQCCGDMVLAHAFHDNQIALNGSWPNIQGARPDTLDYDEFKWCHAAVTFHHTSPEQVEQLWQFDREVGLVKNITYSDIFWKFVQPSLQPEANEWDCGGEDILYPPKRSREEFEADPEASWEPSPEEEAAVFSFEGCRDACQRYAECFSFVYRPNVTSEGQPLDTWPGQCGLRMETIVLGEKSTEGLDVGRGAVRSGWEIEKIQTWTREHSCDQAKYITWWGDDGSLEPTSETSW